MLTYRKLTLCIAHAQLTEHSPSVLHMRSLLNTPLNCYAVGFTTDRNVQPHKPPREESKLLRCSLEGRRALSAILLPLKLQVIVRETCSQTRLNSVKRSQMKHLFIQIEIIMDLV